MPDFVHTTKGREFGMKVLVHLNHGVDKSYLLNLEGVENKKVRRILESSNQDLAIQKLMACSTTQVEIAPNKKQQAQDRKSKTKPFKRLLKKKMLEK